MTKTNFIDKATMPSPNFALRELINRTTDGNIVQFAKPLSVTNEAIRKLVRPRADGSYYPISAAIQQNIAEVYDLPNNWLDVEMKKVDELRGDTSNLSSRYRSLNICPHFENIEHAGISLKDVPVSEYIMYPRIKQLPPYDVTMTVKGDNMEPTFGAGDVVALRYAPSSSFYQWGRAYVLCTKRGIIFGRLYSGEQEDTYICASDNSQYDKFSIPQKDVVEVYLVVGSIHSES